MSAKNIAFVGLGTMGRGMVACLLDAGHRLRLHNRSPEPLKEFGDRGAEICESPAHAAKGSEFLIACVSDDAALETVVRGRGGLLEGAEAGALLIDCGTTSLELTRSLALECAEGKLGFIGAPITGSKLGAQAGGLTIMAGGATAEIERARPLFEIMGKHLVHVGEEPASGQAAKFALNMSQAVILQGLLEGYALARKLGVPLSKMSEILENSAGRTGVGVFKTPFLRAGDYEPHFRLDLMQKDLHLALGEASRMRLPLPAAQSVRTIYDQGVAQGWGDRDFLVLARFLEQWGDLSWDDEPLGS